MDECILKALIRSVSDIGYDALHLAMNLHQCDDVVQSIVEAESDINERHNINNTCFRALTEGQLPFVKLFLEVGFEMKRFLTPNRLAQLYEHTLESSDNTSSPLLRLLNKTVGPRDSYSLDDIYFTIYYYTLAYPVKSLVDLPDDTLAQGNIADNKQGGDSPTLNDPSQSKPTILQKGFEDPFRELCFWSLFSLQPQLCQFFWSKAKDPLILSLMCARLWHQMYNCLSIGEMDLKEEVSPLVDEYTQLALLCLEEYQSTNMDLSSYLLTYKNPKFGGIDLIDVAGFTDNKDFIATSDAQICIEHKWKKGMRCSFRGIIFSVLCPPSIPSIYSENLSAPLMGTGAGGEGDSNDNGLSLEEEILLLEQQSQLIIQRQRQQLLKQQEVDKQKTEQQRKSAASLNGDPAQSPASVIKSQPQEPRESHSKLPKKSKKSKSIKKDKNRKEAGEKAGLIGNIADGGCGGGDGNTDTALDEMTSQPNEKSVNQDDCNFDSLPSVRFAEPKKSSGPTSSTSSAPGSLFRRLSDIKSIGRSPHGSIVPSGDKSQNGGGGLEGTGEMDELSVIGGMGQLDDNTGVQLRQTTYSQFYHAPATKFFLHISMYFLFLVIYTYFYCYENKPGLLDNKWKLTIFIYMLSYVIEIIWHFHQGDIGIKVKLLIWCSSEWNLLDVTYLSMGLVAFFCSVDHGWPMTIARALYGLTSILMWIRLLRFYLANEKLGSMWIMIRRMLWETLIFMTHMGIMIIASGISLYCINN
ncbi:uncharacterized protein LOC142355034, partial [Convolutriloba macropyga]|uniref:uncharacterized protein LOC142355034 n=1 Tax=Convolutriloba macropyga TaxID=536237 RepID=UPI003F526530